MPECEPERLRQFRQPPEVVYLSLDGALVTSRWIVIGEHTFSTLDVREVFVRWDENRLPALATVAGALVASILYVPAAIALSGVAVLLTLRGMWWPRLQLILRTKDRDTVLVQAVVGASDATEAMLHEVHSALVLAATLGAATTARARLEGAQ